VEPFTQLAHQETPGQRANQTSSANATRRKIAAGDTASRTLPRRAPPDER
jgi:hypothetical protein